MLCSERVIQKEKCMLLTLRPQSAGYVSNAEHDSIVGLDGIFNKLSLSLTDVEPTPISDTDSERPAPPHSEWAALVPFTARNIVLQRCGQTEPADFQYYYPDSLLGKCHKIGEGVYGEVFLLKNAEGGATVLKIIPIEGEIQINGENQKKYDEIISEIIIAQELSALRDNYYNQTQCFAFVQAVHCVRGRYPARLIDLWDLYDENKGSENDNPSIFSDEQLYIVLELEHGGRDLECFEFLNAEQSFAVLLQTAYTLAVGECALKFEHRDLHWGNVLIAHTEDKEVNFTLNGEKIAVPSRGVKVTIIDFTLSRVTYDNVCIYNNLAMDPDLFKSHGDYQFEIYKLMQRRNQNDWEHFEPYSNVLWLHYIIDKMINGARYKRPTSIKHMRNINLMKTITEELLMYESAENFVKIYDKNQ